MMHEAMGKRRKKELRRPFVVTVAALSAASLPVAVAVGCGDDKPPYSTPGSWGGQPPLTNGSCSTEGATQACSINLGTANGFHSCFAGTQTCTGGLWSKCGGQGVVTSSAPGVLSPAGLHPSGSRAAPP